MEQESIFSTEELQIRVILTKILDSATNIVNEITMSYPDLLTDHIEQFRSIVDHARDIGKHNAEIIFNDPNQIIYFRCKGNSNYIYGIPEKSMDVDRHLYAHEFTCFECHDKNCCPEAFNLDNLFGSCILGKNIQ